ncbi:MAG TPA: ComEC/Rec2 family competence protein [Candidatus Paceibacterota bacterium]|nr:ComEC/Rec2 family competence protein [Candidatus Paceibacterota bacterium]
MSKMLLLGFLGFASGILCRSLFFFPWPILLAGILFAAIFLYAFSLKQRAAYLMVAAVLLGAVLGAGRTMLADTQLPSVYVPLIGTEIALEGWVAAEPDIRETTQRVTLEVTRGGASTRVLAVAPLYPIVAYGEEVLVLGTLALPESFEGDTGRTFRYDRFLEKDGIHALVERARLESLAPPKGVQASVMGGLLFLKQRFQEGLSTALPEPGASLASGLITGGKQGLGDSLLDAFIVAGLVHIVVLSGYNVMLVAEGVLRGLSFLPRRTAAIAAGITIALFVLAAGAGSASVRAGLMAGLALLARATGRTYAVVRALLVVGMIMLVLNPLLLVYDPGFQLSFIATLGLIIGAPLIAARLAWIKSEFWRELVAATIAAQVAVLPLLLYQTGLLSIVSFPANLLVLPAVPLAMALSAIAGIAGIVSPFLAPIIGLPAHLLLSYIVEVARIGSELPASSLVVPEFPFIAVVLAYLGLVYVVKKATASVQSPRPLKS